MFKLIFIIKCLSILVTSNSFQGFQTYPQVAYQQNYVNHDQPIMTQMVDGYPQLLLQNTWPSYQNVPLTYQDTSKGYYNNFLINSAPNAFVDANARIYDQNGFDIMQYISSPRDVNPNVLSNYVTIPQTYLKNQCIDNERQLYFPLELTVTTQGNQHFQKTNDIRPSKNYDPNGNEPSQNIEWKSKNNKKRKSCQSKRVRNREENQEKNVKYKPSSKNYKRKNNLSNNNDEEQNYKCKNNANDNSMLKKNINENNILDKKSKANQKSKYKDQTTTDETVHIRDTGCQSKILSEDNCECLDINENCVELENRRTRNNYNANPVQTFQQFPNMPKEFNNNIASYINSFMPNQNFNADLFTANGNFPFNFDYMNQMPQNSNSNQNGSEKKRRNRRRKKKPKNNRTSTNDNDRSSKNNNENSNKNQQIEDDRDKVVELLPNKPVEIKLKTKLIPAESVQIDDIVPDKKLTKVEEEEILPDKIDENLIEVILEPTSIIIDDTHDQNLQLPVSQEYTINVYDNDIFDDYYPDFTSDNIYLSKEDQDYNFHDRHYYSADNKAGINRERRKYEPSARQNHKINRIDTLVSDESVDNSIKKVKKIASIEEVKFKTPPGLDFPDFKTEMINKDKYSLRSDINYPSNKYQNKQSDKVSSFSRVKSIEPNPEKNIDNAVETIFARTKVAKYGVPETDEKTNKSFGEFNVTDKSTNDEKTTIVLAKSLNYPVGYK